MSRCWRFQLRPVFFHPSESRAHRIGKAKCRVEFNLLVPSFFFNRFPVVHSQTRQHAQRLRIPELPADGDHFRIARRPTPHHWDVRFVPFLNRQVGIVYMGTRRDIQNANDPNAPALKKKDLAGNEFRSRLTQWKIERRPEFQSKWNTQSWTLNQSWLPWRIVRPHPPLSIRGSYECRFWSKSVRACQHLFAKFGFAPASRPHKFSNKLIACSFA